MPSFFQLFAVIVDSSICCSKYRVNQFIYKLCGNHKSYMFNKVMCGWLLLMNLIMVGVIFNSNIIPSCIMMLLTHYCPIFIVTIIGNIVNLYYIAFSYYNEILNFALACRCDCNNRCKYE